ncbi:MAG: hypothetical protein V4564_18245 [Pseudomonadota bacterium]|uniref:hypothetical protein n=1 Tax=Sphingomonas sp. ERG5 TaxID=1381597 RepID=UPI00126A399D|nr:hypothetical protein [Sphingomonas sp. ERG5]
MRSVTALKAKLPTVQLSIVSPAFSTSAIVSGFAVLETQNLLRWLIVSLSDRITVSGLNAPGGIAAASADIRSSAGNDWVAVETRSDVTPVNAPDRFSKEEGSPSRVTPALDDNSITAAPNIRIAICIEQRELIKVCDILGFGSANNARPLTAVSAGNGYVSRF